MKRAKRGTIKSIEEHLAYFCATALKSRRIQELEEKCAKLTDIITRYEFDFLPEVPDLSFCCKCDQFRHDTNMYRCETPEAGCGVDCYDCSDKIRCYECGIEGCLNCTTICGAYACDNDHTCNIRLCKKCDRKTTECNHPCMLCTPKKEDNE